MARISLVRPPRATDKRRLEARLCILVAVAVNATNCKPSASDYLTTDADPIRGGALWDTWWVVPGVREGIEPGGQALVNGVPVTSSLAKQNPLYAVDQALPSDLGAESWTCKACHGWVYKGRDGHLPTPFGGLLEQTERTPLRLFRRIKHGRGIPHGALGHAFGNVMSDSDIIDLVGFIKEAMIDADALVDSATGLAKGDPQEGERRYQIDCLGCHAPDGSDMIATDNQGRRVPAASLDPWRSIHKIRFGEPDGSMPNGLSFGYLLRDVGDVLAYLQQIDGPFLSAPIHASPEDTVRIEVSALESLGAEPSYAIEQISGPTASFLDSEGPVFSIALASLEAYKDYAIGLHPSASRWMVQPLTTKSLATAQKTAFKITIGGDEHAIERHLQIWVSLPFAATTGLRVVPLNTPVVLRGAEQVQYAWDLTDPTGTQITPYDAGTRYPWFLPDKMGHWTAMETLSNVAVTVDVGVYEGVVAGLDGTNEPAPLLPEGACTDCHRSADALQPFSSWSASAHATFVANLMENGDVVPQRCLKCHALGFNPSALNNGLDDASDFEAFLASQATNSDTVPDLHTVIENYPQAARFGSVQCESCHGPQVGASGSQCRSAPNPSRRSSAAAVCLRCHDGAHGRDIEQGWPVSKHSNLERAVSEGTVERRGSLAGHCGRCHTAQGFLAWVKKPEDLGAWVSRDQDFLAELGLTEAEVEPQTCVVCHDPHAAGGTQLLDDGIGLRFTDSTPVLPSGFAAVGVGRGAVCILCHNALVGARHDHAVLPQSYSAPHSGTEADVMLGQNAYFVPIGQRSAHGFLPDTCAECHITRSGTSASEHSHTNHSFSANRSICSGCHSGLEAEDIIVSTAEALARLQEMASETAVADLNNLATIQVRAFNEATGLYSSSCPPGPPCDPPVNVGLDLATNPVVHVGFLSEHGQMALHLEFASPIDITWSDGSRSGHSEFTVQMASLKHDVGSGPEPVYGTGSPMFKAIWNTLFLTADGSGGIHNPAWVHSVIANTVAQDLRLVRGRSQDEQRARRAP